MRYVHLIGILREIFGVKLYQRDIVRNYICKEDIPVRYSNANTTPNSNTDITVIQIIQIV